MTVKFCCFVTRQSKTKNKLLHISLSLSFSHLSCVLWLALCESLSK